MVEGNSLHYAEYSLIDHSFRISLHSTAPGTGNHGSKLKHLQYIKVTFRVPAMCQNNIILQ